MGKVRQEQISKLNFKKLVLKSQLPLTAIADGAKQISDKIITIDMVQNAAKLIVGRERPANIPASE